jgi:glycine betaine/proline transport system substrate-binding protein
MHFLLFLSHKNVANASMAVLKPTLIKNTLRRRIPRGAIFYALAFFFALAAPTLQAQGEKLRLGQANLSFYAVTGGVVQEVLARSGVAFDVVEGTHPELYAKLGAGQIDILASTWLPRGHAEHFARVKDKVFVLSRLYGDGRHFLAVPDFAPADISSIADLARPDVAAQFGKDIAGIGASAGLSASTARAMDAYGLKAAGYSFRPGKVPDWQKAITSAFQQKRNIVFPLWQPQWINTTHHVRILADPLNVFGDLEEALILATNDLPSHISPLVLERLKRITLSITAVSDMDRMMHLEGAGPREAARRWMEAHPETVARWMATP